VKRALLILVVLSFLGGYLGGLRLFDDHTPAPAPAIVVVTEAPTEPQPEPPIVRLRS
jgi:hypothetical protein